MNPENSQNGTDKAADQPKPYTAQEFEIELGTVMKKAWELGIRQGTMTFAEAVGVAEMHKMQLLDIHRQLQAHARQQAAPRLFVPDRSGVR